MNPLTNMKNVTKLSEQELFTGNKTSWHDQYRDSAWVFIGGLPYDLTEGDIVCIFSQYGEIVNINLIRDKDNGKSKGFCFLCYEDQRSTILAVDNLNGIKVLNRILRVDHVSNYKVPKEGKKTDAETKKLYEEGCAPKAEVPIMKNIIVKTEPQDVRETLADQIHADIRLPARLPIYPIKTEPLDDVQVVVKKEKKDKKKRKKSKSKRRDSDYETSSESENEKRKKKTKRKISSGESDGDSERDDSQQKKSYKHKDSRTKEMKNSIREINEDCRRNNERDYDVRKNTERDRKIIHSEKYERSRHRSRSRSLDRSSSSKKHRSKDYHRVRK